eukprot:4184626-Pyramimonas_sp.AAC.1
MVSRSLGAAALGGAATAPSGPTEGRAWQAFRTRRLHPKPRGELAGGGSREARGPFRGSAWDWNEGLQHS